MRDFKCFSPSDIAACDSRLGSAQHSGWGKERVTVDLLGDAHEGRVPIHTILLGSCRRRAAPQKCCKALPFALKRHEGRRCQQQGGGQQSAGPQPGGTRAPCIDARATHFSAWAVTITETYSPHLRDRRAVPRATYLPWCWWGRLRSTRNVQAASERAATRSSSSCLDGTSSASYDKPWNEPATLDRSCFLLIALLKNNRGATHAVYPLERPYLCLL